MDELLLQSVEHMIVLSEDQNYNPPTLAYCEQWANQQGVNPARVVMDPNFETLFSYVDNYAGDTIGLPWEAVLDGRGMIYEWHNLAAGSAIGTIDELLYGPPMDVDAPPVDAETDQ